MLASLADATFVATLASPPAVTGGLGARVEVPVTRQVASAWQPAVIDGVTGVAAVTLQTPLVAGEYQLVWRNETDPAELEVFVPLLVAVDSDVPVAPSVWAPTVQDVADLCPAYTRAPIDGDGESAGAQRRVFDETTNPTAGDVTGFIVTAVQEITGRVGTQLVVRVAALATRTAAWHAAATVEAERAPEGSEDASSAYRWKQASYVACLNELIAQARAQTVVPS